MASLTPKLDRIINQFTSLIGYPATYDGNGDFQPSDVLTKAQVESYVSKAMFKLFNQFWQMATQNKKTIKDIAQTFLAVFPELVRTGSITFTGAGVYTIINPNLDFYYPFGASDSNKYFARILDATYFEIVKAEIYPQYTAVTAKPIIIYLEGKLNLFPAAAVSYDVSFITKPVIPSTGGIFTQGSAAVADHPFTEHWEPIIAEKADQIYRQERQIGRN